MSLFVIAGFLIALGVLFVMMAGAQASRADRKIVPIPPQGVQTLALAFFVAGTATLAYAYYDGTPH